jgi:alpha/beta superfamily hydrolase
MEPLYLQLERGPVFATFHPADGDTGVAVVLCPPFGWEDMTSYRARLGWAEHLAGGGVPALRIDLPGTADSAGGPYDDALPEAWSAAVAGAARWLRERTRARRIAVIGLGTGGLAAGQAVIDGAPIDDLVLWGVPGRGRTLLRELRAFTRLEASLHAEGGAGPDPEAPEGALVGAGYVLTRESQAAIEAIDLTAAAPLAAPAPRVLLLDRDGVPVDDRLRAGLEAAGAEVTVAPGPGYGDVMVGDMRRVQLPEETFATVSAWLDQARPPAEHPRTDAATAAEAVRATPVAELDGPAGPVRETPLSWRGPRGALFGVLTEPRDGAPDLCVVLLNAGPQRRTGPNRMWVELARRWAPRGVAVLRLDTAGIGDADGEAHGWEQERAFYEPERLEEVGAALDLLGERGLPPRFVLVGLCSGANWGFHLAQRDPRVAAAVLLNPRALFWEPWMEASHDARRARELAGAAAWRRLLSGDIPLRTAVRGAWRVLRWALRWPLERLRRRSAPAAAGELESAIARLETGGRRLLVVFTDREPLRERLEADGGMERLAASPAVDLHVVPTAAEMHTLPQLWLQRRVAEIVDGMLEREREAAATARGDRRTPDPA